MSTDLIYLECLLELDFPCLELIYVICSGRSLTGTTFSTYGYFRYDDDGIRTLLVSGPGGLHADIALIK